MFSGEILGQNAFIRRQFVKAPAKTTKGTERFMQNSTMSFCSFVPCECLKKISPYKFSLRDFVSKNYYDAQLGFFCKKELQLEKITTVPIRFRLGCVDYVNWMEGKPNAIIPR
jgi:hypothetical protein